MRTRSLALLLTGMSATLLAGQSRLPPDINATSLLAAAAARSRVARR